MTAGNVAPSHLHSQDEIIHVLDGTLTIGRATAGAGASVAVPAGRRYGFRTSSGFRFVNYRRDVAFAIVRPGSQSFLETLENIRAAELDRS